MQQRRYRPGDVLDDYCPRERRITDHAIVAMIDDRIKQTRCVVCDAEHEYKDGKVPPQRRKKPQAALFAQVLDGLQGGQPSGRVAPQPDLDGDVDDVLPDDGPGRATPLMPPAAQAAVTADAPPVTRAEESSSAAVMAGPVETVEVEHGALRREEGLWRRQLIRAALPRPEGQAPPQTRPAPDFTVRQPSINHPQRHGGGGGGGRRHGGGHPQGQGGNHAPMRFGRGTPGQGQAQAQGQGSGRSRRRGKKR